MKIVSALMFPLLTLMLLARQSQAQPSEIRLQPGSVVTVAPGQTTTVLCEAGAARCFCTYDRSPGEFSYELNWIAPTLPPITTTLARYWGREDCLVAMGQAPECQR